MVGSISDKKKFAFGNAMLSMFYINIKKTYIKLGTNQSANNPVILIVMV